MTNQYFKVAPLEIKQKSKQCGGCQRKVIKNCGDPPTSSTIWHISNATIYVGHRIFAMIALTFESDPSHA